MSLSHPKAVRFSSSQLKLIDRYARDSGQKRSAIVREAIELGIPALKEKYSTLKAKK